MAYSTAALVKEILQIDVTTYDTEIGGCVTSADALIDSLLKQKGAQAVPESTPQNIIDSSKYFAAWLFRRRRDPAGAEVYWEEGNRFLEAYAPADEETEFPFKVCSDS
jgi:hypothetical protein